MKLKANGTRHAGEVADGGSGELVEIQMYLASRYVSNTHTHTDTHTRAVSIDN